jgi:ATP-dependent RNA helicase DDX23/PRP28
MGPPAPPPGLQNVPTGPRAERNKYPNATSVPPSSSAPGSMAPPPPPPPPDDSTYTPDMDAEALSAIRSQYLGVDKKKRKIRKINDRKFVFDWDTGDDTYDDHGGNNSIKGSGQGTATFTMFGRGRLGGVDDGGGLVVRKGTGSKDVKMGGTGMDERHWTDKKLEEMKERDWRIFREDFSITARGITRLIISSLPNIVH